MSSRARQAAREKSRQTVNALTNTVYNDPSALKFALDSVDSSVGGMIASSPNLKGAAAGALRTELSEKAREQIAKAAAIGYISKTGNVPTWVSDPQYSKYVNGAELEQFRKAAEAQNKANIYYQRQIEALDKQRADLQVHQDAAKLFTDSVTIDPNNPNKPLIAPDFMQKALDIARKNPNAPSAAATVRTYIDWAESQSRLRAEPVVSDSVTKADLLGRMFDPNKPTTETDILKAEAQDKLNNRDGTILRALVKETGPEALRDPVVHAAIGAAEERVGMHLMIDGHERYSNFLQQFWPEYLRQKRAGTLPANALDMNDPNSLIRQSLKTWEPTPAERMRAQMLKNLQAVGGTAPEPAPVAPTAAPGGGTFTPPANWQWNPGRKQYRDPAGNLYDKDGKPVKAGPVVPMSR
jgi:hypothetical protein